MRRPMTTKIEADYIIQKYNRHMKMNPDEDFTVQFATQDILNWMNDNKQFDNVIFDPNIKGRQSLYELLSEQEQNKIIQNIFKSKIHHRKKTIEIVLKQFLLKDLYYEDEYDFLEYFV